MKIWQNIKKSQEYYKNDYLKIFLLHVISLLIAPIVKNSDI